MTQEEVYDFLDKHKDKYYITNELAKTLNISKGSVISNVKRLLKGNFIKERIRHLANKYVPSSREVGIESDK